ncbi:MAG: phosphoribosylamine--glycine ligase [Thermacetogeniaceae bacterium]
MKILVVGGGGREHALVWKLRQSPRVSKIYCAPGNAGIAQDAECVPLAAEDLDGLLDFARSNGIDLTVVGPEAPLVAGIRDRFEEAGLRLFGPPARGALIEGSKSFAKELMTKFRVPTAPFEVFDSPKEAISYVRRIGGPCVVKADGLAAGKGVIVAKDASEAEAAVRLIGEEKAFGKAGDRIIVEECLVGEEVSVFAFTDGKSVLPMVAAQDHKRVYDGDKGPNTGGMGAYSPPPVYTPELHDRVCKEILEPIVAGMAAEGIRYQGVLYAGLMITEEGPYVLEFNCRFGDPEAQVVIPRLKTDLVDVMEAVLDGRLEEIALEWDHRSAVCVVLASGGYPGSYEKGKAIRGLDEVPEGILVFHAATALSDGDLVTSGGRVLGVTAFGETIREAVERAYEGVSKISFEGMHYRRDIAYRALEREGASGR